MRYHLSAGTEDKVSGLTPGRLVAVAFWVLVLTLAWAPFPLGSNRPWSVNLLSILIAICWIVWGLATWHPFGRNWTALNPIKWPLLLGALTLIWAVLQTSSLLPDVWKPAVWTDASRILGRPLSATISINPWRTLAEVIKLITYGAVMILAFLLARREEWAERLLNAFLVIATVYSAYTLMLRISGYIQYQFFYSTPSVTTGLMSGPFVSHNSYAAFAGLGSIAAVVKLTLDVGRIHTKGLGLRRSALNILQFSYAEGGGTILALILTTCTLFASASRAGVFATIVSVLAVMLVQAFFQTQSIHAKWNTRACSGVVLLIALIAAANGSVLGSRLYQLANAGGIDSVRVTLWEAALRMIRSAPWTGFGLGTFQDAYPQFADGVLPYVVDKAHNDYLEFAAGLGLPAAAAWLFAWLWLGFLNVRGVFVRRRNRHYSLIAFGATVLIAVHSLFDFSLQIPAIAMSYAMLLGLGLAQSFPTRN